MNFLSISADGKENRKIRMSPSVPLSLSAQKLHLWFLGEGVPKNGGSRRGEFRRAERFSGCLSFISAPEPPRSEDGAGKASQQKFELNFAPRNGAGSKPSFRMQKTIPRVAAWDLSGKEETFP